MSSLTVWRRRVRPSFVLGEARRVARKIARKARRPESRVVHLPARGDRRGRALVSYIIDGLLVDPARELPRSHTNFWESRQIAWTFRDLGFDVDAIHWTNGGFVPSERYDVCLDVRLNLERLAPLLDDDCIKIQHLETAHHAFHNAAQLRRLDALEDRRGVRLTPHKMMQENRAIETADFGITVGNDFTIDTYAHTGTPIRRVPISVPQQYPSPSTKDFATCRSTFVWFGSDGLVHKGLDLVLEAFAGLPDHQLVVCGPIHTERDFEAEYARELYDTPNIETLGWVDVAGERFRQLLATTLGVVYPSCSEGGGGSVITCLHGGLIPLVTRETSVDLDGFGVALEDLSIDGIRAAVVGVSELAGSELRDRAVAGWEHVRRVHTREAFAANYRRVVEQILPGGGESDRG